MKNPKSKIQNPKSSEKPCILIIDDDESTGKTLKFILEKQGYLTAIARTGQGTIAKARTTFFNAALVDIGLPDIQGVELLRPLKKIHPDMIIIMMTAYASLESSVQSLNEGASAYITKPFDLDAVLEKLTGLLEKQRLTLENRRLHQSLHHELDERKMVEKALKKSKAELEKTLEALKESQMSLIQSEKMASIGQLAAGVAHEINNPTGFVGSNLNTLVDYQNDYNSLMKECRKLVVLLEEKQAQAEIPLEIAAQVDIFKELATAVDIDFIQNDSRSLINESLDGIERIKKIVIDLKDFAHPGDQERKYVDINRNLESTLNIVWNELKYKAVVIKNYGDMPEVDCYPQQLNQVFMNLLVNAAQAIEKKGEIRLETRAIDGSVEIKISDTGAGVPPENLSRIFDPFFTTKEVGKGTGLGLNVAYNIVNKHNGTIEVESKVGEGTTFIVRIPVG